MPKAKAEKGEGKKPAKKGGAKKEKVRASASYRPCARAPPRTWSTL